MGPETHYAVHGQTWYTCTAVVVVVYGAALAVFKDREDSDV